VLDLIGELFEVRAIAFHVEDLLPYIFRCVVLSGAYTVDMLTLEGKLYKYSPPPPPQKKQTKKHFLADII